MSAGTIEGMSKIEAAKRAGGPNDPLIIARAIENSVKISQQIHDIFQQYNFSLNTIGIMPRGLLGSAVNDLNGLVKTNQITEPERNEIIRLSGGKIKYDMRIGRFYVDHNFEASPTTMEQ